MSVKFKVDTGAQTNILPTKYFDALPRQPPLTQSTQRLTSYCGSKIPVKGVCQLKRKHHSKILKPCPFPSLKLTGCQF